MSVDKNTLQRTVTKRKRRFLTYSHAAAELNCGKRKVIALVAAGEIQVVNLAGPGDPRPQLRIDRADLEAFIERRRVQPAETVPTIRRRTPRGNQKVKTFFD
jgi:excisionase family DNA binding protein